MSEKLKECPWCKAGGISPLFHYRQCFINIFDDAKASGIEPEKDVLIDAWNRRASDWVLDSDKPLDKLILKDGDRYIIEYKDRPEFYVFITVGEDDIKSGIIKYATFNL